MTVACSEGDNAATPSARSLHFAPLPGGSSIGASTSGSLACWLVDGLGAEAVIRSSKTLAPRSLQIADGMVTSHSPCWKHARVKHSRTTGIFLYGSQRAPAVTDQLGEIPPVRPQRSLPPSCRLCAVGPWQCAALERVRGLALGPFSRPHPQQPAQRLCNLVDHWVDQLREEGRKPELVAWIPSAHRGQLRCCAAAPMTMPRSWVSFCCCTENASRSATT